MSANITPRIRRISTHIEYNIAPPKVIPVAAPAPTAAEAAAKDKNINNNIEGQECYDLGAMYEDVESESGFNLEGGE